MNRIAVISDIHANLPALEAVLHYVEKQGAETILCAGDVIGYNAFPNEVVRLLKEKDVMCISGNHDQHLITGDYSNFNSVAAASLRWTASVVDRETMEFLRALPETLKYLDISVYHGSPEDPERYVFEDMVSAEMTDISGTRITVLGHTHVPFILRFGLKAVLNPGSVGQPRDGDPRASCIIIDGREMKICRVTYDIESVVRKNREALLPEAISERLAMGL